MGCVYIKEDIYPEVMGVFSLRNILSLIKSNSPQDKKKTGHQGIFSAIEYPRIRAPEIFITPPLR